MAQSSRRYIYRKFKVRELANALKAVIDSFNVNSDDLKITHDFIEDEISDQRKLSLKEIENLYYIEEDEHYSFSFHDNKEFLFIILSKTHENEFSATVNAPTADIIKKIFSILENELSLKLTNDSRNEVDSLKHNNKTLKTSKSSDKLKKTSLERIKKGHTDYFYYLKLFSEDIIQITHLFIDNFNQYELQLDSDKINSKDMDIVKNDLELVKNKLGQKSPKELAIRGYDSGYTSDLSLIINDSVAWVSVSDEYDFKNLGLLYKINMMMSEKENKLLKNFLTMSSLSFVILTLILILIATILILLGKLKIIDASIALKLTLTIVMLPFLLAIIGLVLSSKNKNKIHLALYKENKSFWSRNKDNLVVGIVVGVIVAIIAGVLKIL